jgi:hypothetical protein
MVHVLIDLLVWGLHFVDTQQGFCCMTPYAYNVLARVHLQTYHSRSFEPPHVVLFVLDLLVHFVVFVRRLNNLLKYSVAPLGCAWRHCKCRVPWHCFSSSSSCAFFRRPVSSVLQPAARGALACRSCLTNALSVRRQPCLISTATLG